MYDSITCPKPLDFGTAHYRSLYQARRRLFLVHSSKKTSPFRKNWHKLLGIDSKDNNYFFKT